MSPPSAHPRSRNPDSFTHREEVNELPVIDIDELRRVMEEYSERRWTDGLPVMPVTESVLAEFLSQTNWGPDEVLLGMPHLDRECTVRTAAINAAMAGCRPEYFPVVLAAWSALRLEGYVERAIWQSTTGTAPMLLVNGPVRERIGLNSQGNVFGSGFRANATIGRAIRLTAINAFGLRPHELDQATQGNPAKYTACIAENEERSPWTPFHVEHGFDIQASTVTAMTMRSVVHIEARHTTVPEQLALPDSAAGSDEVRVLNSEQALQIVVAGAHNSGVSAVIETFGPRGGPPAIAPVESSPA
jgi:hypothetical protein